MDELYYVYATAGVIGVYFLARVAAKRFDPFEPIWLFFVGYIQIYVIQAISYHDWAVGIRGTAIVTEANSRALWGLLWFLAVYHLGPGRLIAGRLPAAPRGWSAPTVAVIAPLLIVWGMLCAGVFGGRTASDEEMSAEGALLRAFPFVMMVGSILLITTGRRISAPHPAFLAAGLATAGFYVLIWMFNAKRSHSLMGVLTTICALYITRQKRPSWAVLGATAFAGALVVAVSIGWRNNPNYERSVSGFIQFVTEFDPSMILVSMDVAEEEGQEDVIVSHESKEYGGYLLMLDTVPEKTGYDYGANYLRVFSTYIPRIVWPSKPIYGRDKWIAAWMAGSELERREDFAGPAIGLLGATQLNGGATATLIVLAVGATFFRALYEFFRLHAHAPWTQFFWAIFFFNAWFMVVGDDPVVWYYYNWGFSAFPVVVVTWFAGRWFPDPERSAVATPSSYGDGCALSPPTTPTPGPRRFMEGATT